MIDDTSKIKVRAATSLKADRAQLEIFFRVLYRNVKSGFVSLRGFTENKTIAFNPECYSPIDPSLLDAAVRLTNLSGETPGVVFCSPTATFNNPDKATAGDVANGVAISVDLDETNPQKAREILESILGPATIVVASGGEWKDVMDGKIFLKSHLHWRLSKPTETPEEHGRLNQVRKRAAELIKGDRSAGNVVHPMRIPGSWHTKTEPRLCRIIDLREGAEISLEQAESALRRNLPSKSTSERVSASDKKPNQKNLGNTEYGKAALEEEISILRRAVEGERNNCLNKAAFTLGQLVGGGELDEGFVIDLLLSAAISISLSASEARGTITSGIASGKGSPRSAPQNDGNNRKSSHTPPDQSQAVKLRTGAEIRNLDIKMEYLIDKIIPKNAVSLIFGRGGIGKTTLALQMCGAIAAGEPFLGMVSEKVPVIYIDFENPLAVLSDRLKVVQADQVLFWSSTDSPVKLDGNIEVYLGLLKAHPNALFVFDTLRSAQDGDENDSRVMAAVMKPIRMLRDQAGTVVLLHHTKKDADDVYKGSTAIFDLVDHVVGLYPLKVEEGKTVVDDGSGQGKIYYFGTKNKTRFQPFELHLRFDENNRLFALVTDPMERILAQIREQIPENGIIQKDILLLLDQALGIKKTKALSFLKEGSGRYWSVEKDSSNNNTVTYRRFSGFPGHIEEGKPENQENKACKMPEAKRTRKEIYVQMDFTGEGGVLQDGSIGEKGSQ